MCAMCVCEIMCCMTLENKHYQSILFCWYKGYTSGGVACIVCRHCSCYQCQHIHTVVVIIIAPVTNVRSVRTHCDLKCAVAVIIPNMYVVVVWCVHHFQVKQNNYKQIRSIAIEARAWSIQLYETANIRSLISHYNFAVSAVSSPLRHTAFSLSHSHMLVFYFWKSIKFNVFQQMFKIWWSMQAKINCRHSTNVHPIW